MFEDVDVQEAIKRSIQVEKNARDRHRYLCQGVTGRALS